MARLPRGRKKGTVVPERRNIDDTSNLALDSIGTPFSLRLFIDCAHEHDVSFKARRIYRNRTYVIFHGGCDRWAYAFMKGWKALPRVPFNFHDAHDLGPEVTHRASRYTVRRVLRQRFSSAKNVIVLIGQNTRNLYRYVPWELDVALQLGLPIIAANLNRKRVSIASCARQSFGMNT